MAQTKPFEWYSQDMPRGFAGMKANTSVDVVDTFTAASGIEPGDVVIRDTTDAMQVKAASAAGDGANAVGIALHIHKEPSSPYYEAGTAVSVMSFGDVYVKAGGDVVAGTAAAVKYDADAGISFVATAGGDAVTGVTFMESGAEGEIVRVRVRI